jgi:hypothetical protein
MQELVGLGAVGLREIFFVYALDVRVFVGAAHLLA